MAPIGRRSPSSLPAGYKTVEWAQGQVSDAYGKALAGISAPADRAFLTGIQGVQRQAQQLPKDQRGAFNAIMNLRVTPLVTGKTRIDGPTLQKVYRSLQSDIAGFKKKGDPVADLTASALEDVRDAFMSLAERHAGPNVKAFRAANEASARLSRVEEAAARPNSVNGVFSPSTAASSAARRGYGTTRANAARGDARMQKLADAAKAVLPDTVPNSGTAERGGLMALLGAGGSGALGASVSPWLALPAAGLVNYIPKVDAALQKVSLRGQSPAARAFADQMRQRAYIGAMAGTGVPLKNRDGP